MKFFRFLFKVIVAFLAICGACYIFVEIVENIYSKDSDKDKTDDAPLPRRVIKAADREIHRVNKKISEEKI